ncbi:hypothetical protein [Ammoniphilus sp. YIM 78166]|uniref:hypothetical protein n=1 Tax=Ammoniphilus sp. YIM 78166 TaxID=1644106 RepID=UPI001430A7BE|nr:hypothetical protein [Ammoniphilus sp. YIM 78166]
MAVFTIIVFSWISGKKVKIFIQQNREDIGLCFFISWFCVVVWNPSQLALLQYGIFAIVALLSVGVTRILFLVWNNKERISTVFSWSRSKWHSKCEKRSTTLIQKRD